MQPKRKPLYCEEVLKTLSEVEERCKKVVDTGNGGRKLAISILTRLETMKVRNKQHLSESHCEEQKQNP